MLVSFSQLNQSQRRQVLGHVEAFRHDPELLKGCSVERLERISRTIIRGDQISDDVDSHMLAVYIANTYTGENGDPWFRYLRSLGLPQNLQ